MTLFLRMWITVAVYNIDVGGIYFLKTSPNSSGICKIINFSIRAYLLLLSKKRLAQLANLIAVHNHGARSTKNYSVFPEATYTFDQLQPLLSLHIYELTTLLFLAYRTSDSHHYFSTRNPPLRLHAHSKISRRLKQPDSPQLPLHWTSSCSAEYLGTSVSKRSTHQIQSSSMILAKKNRIRAPTNLKNPLENHYHGVTELI